MSDPTIKVTVFMPASTHAALRNYSRENGGSVSELCRNGALREIAMRPAAELPLSKAERREAAINCLACVADKVLSKLGAGTEP